MTGTLRISAAKRCMRNYSFELHVGSFLVVVARVSNLRLLRLRLEFGALQLERHKRDCNYKYLGESLGQDYHR